MDAWDAGGGDESDGHEHNSATIDRDTAYHERDSAPEGDERGAGQSPLLEQALRSFQSSFDGSGGLDGVGAFQQPVQREQPMLLVPRSSSTRVARAQGPPGDSPAGCEAASVERSSLLGRMEAYEETRKAIFGASHGAQQDDEALPAILRGLTVEARGRRRGTRESKETKAKGRRLRARGKRTARPPASSSSSLSPRKEDDITTGSEAGRSSGEARFTGRGSTRGGNRRRAQRRG